MLAVFTWKFVALLSLTQFADPEVPENGQPVVAEQESETPVSRRIMIPDEPKSVDPTQFFPPELSKPVTVDFEQVALREILDWIENESGMPVKIDRRTMAAENISIADLVSDHLNEQPLYLLLDRLRRKNLDWFLMDGLLHITTVNSAAQVHFMETYNLAHLIDEGYDKDKLLDLIHNMTGPWEEIDGRGGTASWLGDVLFVRQEAQAHRQLQALFQGLAKHGRQTYIYDLPANEALRALMEKKFSVDIDEIPLALAVRELSQIVDADIRLDETELSARRISSREVVSVGLSDRSLRAIFTVMLQNKPLNWMIDDGVIWMTSSNVVSRPTDIALYDVRDLCRDENEAEALREAIADQTKGPWKISDGDGGSILSPRAGTLAVIQTRENHERVSQLLELYRASLLASKPRPELDKSNEVITHFYKMPAAMADNLLQVLPVLINPGSWGEGQTGQILRLNSAPELHGSIAIVNAATSTNSKSGHELLVIEQAVLMIRHTRGTHVEVADIIARVEHGDGNAQRKDEQDIPTSGGMGGGGFGGGFFAIPADRIEATSR